MPLSKKHGLQQKKDRKVAGPISIPGQKVVGTTKRFDDADHVVDMIYCDIANGVSKSDCLRRIQEGYYGNKPLKKRMSQYYYNAALDRFAIDADIEAERLRQVLFGRYESLLEQSIKNNDMYNARGILDSMARIFGVEKHGPQTAVQINGGGNDGSVVVNFGFGNESEVQH